MLTKHAGTAPASSTRLFLFASGLIALAVFTGSLAITHLACPFIKPDHAMLVSAVCSESHYKYLIPLLIPLTSWFIIANWVGWEYFRYA